MASSTPDTSLFTSSAQIFSSNHTLPQIRAIHKALHLQVDDKAARLRTQVGGSYRELLGTADSIVAMRKDMEAVQAGLARAGGRCGRAVVGGKVGALASFVAEDAGTRTNSRRAGGGGAPLRDAGPVARARLLEACVLVVDRALRGGDDGGAELSRGDRLVLAAKLVVLSRLLGSSLGKEGDGMAREVAASVEASLKRMASLRRRVLRSIDKVLENAAEGAADRGDVLKALCAYSLANSSGARDVLRYFLQVRKQAMAYAFQDGDGERQGTSQDVFRGLGLYTRTLLDVQALVPSKLSDALLGLKKDDLLNDHTLREVEALRLDIYERWCGDEIQYFKPYIRHDDLDGSQAKKMLTDWAKENSQVLMQGLEKALEKLSEFKAIVELRTNVLQLWIRDGGRARGFDPSIMLDGLREAINSHMLKVLSTKVNKLRLVGSEVAATLEAWREDITDKHESLWDDTGLDMDLANGAAHFAQDVISRLHGRSDAVSKAVSSYKSWYRVIDDVGEVVAQLKRQRWENDVDEIEDEETIEQRQQLLSKDDPQILHTRLDESLVKAFSELEEQLSERWGAHKDHASSGHIAMYFLRVLRDIRSKLPQLDAVRSFGLAIVPSLHETIAAAVIISPVDEFATSALARKAVVGRALWEGEPALPAGPSPGAFKFLRDLTASLGDAGIDLWSPAALLVLKRRLRKLLGEAWLEALQVIEKERAQNGDKSAQESEENANKDDEKESEKSDSQDQDGEKDDEEEESTAVTKPQPAVEDVSLQKDLMVQWLFDILYLENCLAIPGTGANDEFKDLEKQIAARSGLEDAAARQRLAKASQDYWKRTSLLFGLLA